MNRLPLLGCLALACSATAVEPAYDWQQPQATVSATGDLAWAPLPFVCVKGPSVRYIDFAGGADGNAGTTPQQAWQHHPWDPAATGVAAACSGVQTYVFRRGVVYRGALVADDDGSAGEPIRLTSDPAWGEGEAVIAGSQAVTGWKRGAAPAAVPDPTLVWSATLTFAPRNVWMMGSDGEAMRLPLARTPNWRVTSFDDIKSEWWTWDNKGPGISHFGNKMTVDKRVLNLGVDTRHLTGDLAMYMDAYVWTEYGSVMGTPFPSKVRGVDGERHGLAFGSQWGDGPGSHIFIGCRYYLEDKADFLDDPTGEFWFERTGEGGTLHVILPEGQDPARVRIEAAQHATLIDARHLDHVEISGLTFRWTNTFWDLDALPTRGDETEPSSIRLLGSGHDISVHHCRFVDVNKALRLHARGGNDRLDRVSFTDNDVLRADHDTVVISDGSAWGVVEGPFGTVGDVQLLRNRLQYTGMRPTRYGQGHTLVISHAETMHVAGNILDRTWGSGIHLFGGKSSASNQDWPFTRMLVHHNKVTSTMLNNNDWGGIETWQGGPAYVFGNISGDPGGYWHYNFILDPANARFGHAYYLDGAFKNYHFNNIAWGRSHDTTSPLTATSAFQEIHSYQNSFFNNTAHDFLIGSRRQTPGAGRDKFLGNIWDGIGLHVFRHADPANGPAEANADHAGRQADAFAYDTNAYGSNLFFDVPKLGLFEASGTARDSLADFSAALAERKALRSDVGTMADATPLPKAAQRDFTPTRAADGKGVKVFVPWSLYRCVGEWNFYPSGKDGSVIDEHWDMPEYYCDRQTYRHQPMFPLVPHGLAVDDFVAGPLEDWTKGALRLDGRAQYLSVGNDALTAPVTYVISNRAAAKAGRKEERTVTGSSLKNPQIHASSFLIEAYVAVATGAADGVLMEKMDGTAGYGLNLAGGRPVLAVKQGGAIQAVTGEAALADGAWHHIVAECDRTAKTLTIHVDGVRVGQAPGPGAESLANGADLHVGGTPDGRCLAMTIDFLRICQGSLADARTDIAELRAWQFAGPFLRDFSGRAPTGAGRDAGAIEGP